MPIVGGGENRRSMAYTGNLVQGMVLAAGGKDVFGLVTFEEEGIEPGTQVK